MKLIAIDIGTTNCKAGLFNEDGSVSRIVTKPTVTKHHDDGGAYYCPFQLWNTVSSMLLELTKDIEEPIASIGITSMAETGLLLDRRSGKEKTECIPWFNSCAEEEAQFIESEDNIIRRFQKTGLRASYKFGLPKLLWLKKVDANLLKDSVWLSVSDYIAYKLTGVIATDYTLAARTYAFDIRKKEWDLEWIHHFGLDEKLFPDAYPSGEVIGKVSPEASVATGISEDVPVAISGHDHLCASLSIGATQSGNAFNSIGTAETLIGVLDEYHIGIDEYHTGLTFGCHVLKDKYFWMGNIPSSGGSVEWLRNNLYEGALSYEELSETLQKSSDKPTGLLYFPYLNGSGSPYPSPAASALFMGIKTIHGKSDMIKSVFEGISYQFYSICEIVEEKMNIRIHDVVSVGGGTKNREWMQLKSHIINRSLHIPAETEATLLGAALLAGLGAGIYQDIHEVNSLVENRQKQIIIPNKKIHHQYKKYINSYIQYQGLLKQAFQFDLEERET